MVLEVTPAYIMDTGYMQQSLFDSSVEPQIFMAENVRGLKSHDNGRTLETIINVLTDLGYTVKYEVLNAAYYNVGQKRERIVIVGTKDGVTFSFPKPNKKMTTLQEALEGCPLSEGQSYSQRKKDVLDLVPPGGSWVDLPEDIQKEYMGKSYYSGGGKRGMARRISWNEPCLTLTCSPSQKQTERCHPDETRPFTVREYARIQSFPNDVLNIALSFCRQHLCSGKKSPARIHSTLSLAEYPRNCCRYSIIVHSQFIDLCDFFSVSRGVPYPTGST